MITPLEHFKKISEAYNVSFKVKRDDLYPFTGGGNKGRKIRFILKDAKQNGANALVSAGAANSNHARVVALAGAQMGWPVRLIIHDREDYSNGNLQLMKLTGAKLEFVEMQQVSEAMDQAMEDLTEEGYQPYYIRGGGHSVHGMLAYYEAVDEFRKQSKSWYPDYVILASGTGGTQTGLHVGFSTLLPETKVIGISVARGEKRGKKIIKQSISELCRHLKISQVPNEVIFHDNWTGGGYEETYPDLTDSIKKAAKMDGLITDPTYTGKAITAFFRMCESGTIEKGARVLFWHTGGLINLITTSVTYE